MFIIKKKKENTNYNNNPLDVCKMLFKEGVIFSNENIIIDCKLPVKIGKITRIYYRYEIDEVILKFKNTNTEFLFTLYKNGVYAKIIKNA